MRHSRRFAVDLIDAIKLAEQYPNRDELREKLVAKSYFCYRAPDVIDWIALTACHPFTCIRYMIRHIIHFILKGSI